MVVIDKIHNSYLTQPFQKSVILKYLVTKIKGNIVKNLNELFSIIL